jgi:hypothetical protein
LKNAKGGSQMKSSSEALSKSTPAWIHATILLFAPVSGFSQAGIESLAFGGMDSKELNRRAG